MDHNLKIGPVTIMNKILLIEDSPFFGAVVRNAIASNFTFPVVWAKSYAEAEHALKTEADSFFVALVDLNLPDASDGEAVDLTTQHKVPVIVFTGNLSDDIREKIITKNVVDYVIKSGRHNIEYLVSLVRRLHLNRSIKVLVVDDASTSRMHLRKLLSIYNYIILEAQDGCQALDVFTQHPDIQLVITDYNMPNMDGFEFTMQIRKQYNKSELAVIGLSAQGNNILSAQFLKHGANDFIHKPFLNEEFHCRVSQNVEMVEYIQTVKKLSNLDYLTELVNRRYFFEMGGKLFDNAQRNHSTLSIAMVDIDDFKDVNDLHGHGIGDMVIRKVATLLNDRFRRSDIVARFGGEEFCILASNMAPNAVFRVFDELRQSLAQTDLKIEGKTLNTTVSIGVCSQLRPCLDDMISVADQMLYKAKANGKNQVMWDLNQLD